MSTTADDGDTGTLNIREQVTRIDRNIAEGKKFAAEQTKLSAEAAKLTVEAKKLRVDRFVAPVAVVSGLGGGLAVAILSHFWH